MLSLDPRSMFMDLYVFDGAQCLNVQNFSSGVLVDRAGRGSTASAGGR
ncbi:hypothetical protein LCGC14_0947880 [marine sediment metagenome]|uniref:Uncharacterized protein n=1 Tax=marine sediment metagenome TaxID=412755 RepID=A0A0F9NMW2_9ZZZZ